MKRRPTRRPSSGGVVRRAGRYQTGGGVDEFDLHQRNNKQATGRARAGPDSRIRGEADRPRAEASRRWRGRGSGDPSTKKKKNVVKSFSRHR